MRDYEIPDEPPENGYKILGSPWLDDTGVNVRWMDRNGNIHESNFPAQLWENDKWKNRLDSQIAGKYAEHETEIEKDGSEMDLKVKKEKPKFENAEIDLSQKIKKKKENKQKK